LNSIKKIQAIHHWVYSCNRVWPTVVIKSVSYVLPNITTLPLRKTGGNFSRFKESCDWGPFHLTRPLVVATTRSTWLDPRMGVWAIFMSTGVLIRPQCIFWQKMSNFNARSFSTCDIATFVISEDHYIFKVEKFLIIFQLWHTLTSTTPRVSRHKSGFWRHLEN
jgi:hypothetical protein